jgi:hypothetical protein
MRSLKAVIMFAMLLIALFAAACAASPTSVPTQASAPSAAPTSEPTAETGLIVDFAGDLADFDAATFDDPTNITNPWMPLTPGRQIVLDGYSLEGNLEIPHQIIFTVTDLTKEISGIRTVVVWIEDISDGELVEAELAFYAQDNDGNVWFMGEYPEVYENGRFVEAPAWIPGFKGARPGIAMKADLVAGTPSYSQGWGPAVNWTDRGQVAETGVEVCVPVNCYEDVIMIEEFSQSEPDGFQLKYWAPGVGNVKVGWRGEDANREELELVELNDLSADELAEIRATALEMEARAYEVSKEVYDQTAPSQ